ncbi:LPXTG-domain-containing protein cell wall anchor domain [Enterococcus haemoperoxidus ATCC BAA-382]|uniref:LPXTG-domain-containing protein cell wall anchor domain n=1 Tax=Enterococcus haemoperoxidus ATCC BAA-382 TaxID=1158608 RepID=R2QQ45_9ENTE|nr:Ig-like domain-containing protein [Enterococcus haemoperoxidus]EOH98642.1 LPXTG-domain-containing protein cell wall anchor domain [Enterococcus haemoperoxidus ATCC BAA-382]EOT62175.1 hypothetical protein I583_01175 [Enterococcus haemoperoxidus ATCC BAA-382]OJG55744.1 LPXTG-domain-containing protein cell wall anchor domain [Enterococcus haemoperoxidus]
MMMSVKRFAKISAFLCIFWLLVIGISTKTRAVENSSSTIETHTISSTENKEPQSKISATTNSDSTTLSTEESSIENQINLQPTVKANKEYGSELLTSVSLTDIANNLVHRVKNSDKIKVNYSFSLPDEAQVGDALTFELPAILQMVNYSDFPLLSKMGSEIGIAKIDRATNKVTVIFNQYVSNHNAINGQFFFWVKLVNDQTIDGDNEIPIPVNGTTSDLTLMANKTSGVSTGITNPTTIFKSGKFDSIDPQKINWTISINNSGQNLLMPIINDTLGAGQQLLNGTFSVNYRDVDKKSLKKYPLPSNFEGDLTKVESTLNGFVLSLENLGSYSGLKGYVSAVVNYSTKVTDSSVKYINQVNTLDEFGMVQSRNASLTSYANGGSGNGDVNQIIDSITDKIDEVESIDLDELTESSAKKLTEAKENAQTAVNNEDAMPTDLESATELLVERLVTVEEIAKPADIDELEAIIEQNDGLKEDAYTPETWKTWIDKKTEAIKLIQVAKETPETVSRNEINQITQELKTARANLIEAVTPSETRESELSSEPSTTETTNASQSTTSIQNEKNSGNQQQLLKTGENKSPLLVLIGVLLLLVATWILVAKKQVEN